MNLPDDLATTALGTPAVVNEPNPKTELEKFHEFLDNAATNSAQVAANWATLASRAKYDEPLAQALMMVFSSQPQQR